MIKKYTSSGMLKIYHLFMILVIVLGNMNGCKAYSIQKEPKIDGTITLEVDTNPCGEIVIEKNMEILEQNIIAYYYYEEGEIKAIRIRLTCEYNEKHMPQKEYPSMSYNKFENILKILNNRKSFGNKLEDNPVYTVSGHVITRSRIYENAVVSWAEFSCKNEIKDFGCGIKRINISYK